MKRNTLTTAVLAGLTGMAGMVSVSNAVNVNPDGLGQVLLYPYYTARGGNDTLISVVNTTSQTKAVKVRFIEALNSREVLDFNLYMSPFDVWTAAILENEAGGGTMVTEDTSCTVPYFQGGTPGDLGSQEFLDFQYTGNNPDAGPGGIERTASGYIEVIEMGTLEPGSQVAQAAKHVNGAPRSDEPPEDEFGAPCSLLVSSWASASPAEWGQGFQNDINPEDQTSQAGGGLFGAASIVNPQNGTMFSYNATAIDGFYKRVPGDGATAQAHTSPGSILPNLNSGDNFESNVFINGQIETSNWDINSGVDGLLAVNATLTKDRLFNEYNVETAASANTEWVVTFPTKRFHTDNAVGGFTSSAVPPFTSTWWAISGGSIVRVGDACEQFQLDFWDREEQRPEQGVIVSPPPPEPGFRLCREANVIRFANESGNPESTEILGEPMRDGFGNRLSYTNFRVEDFDHGWTRFDLALDGSSERLSLPSQEGTQYAGLPVLGFAVTTITNGNTADGVLSNYGATFDHRGSRRVIQD